MVDRRHNGPRRRGTDDGRFAATRTIEPLNRRRPGSVAYRPTTADRMTCADCGGTGLRATSLDPYGGGALRCRSCTATNGRQDWTIFVMQMAIGCGIGVATLAVVLL